MNFRDAAPTGAFVLLLFAGYVKGSPLLGWTPVDLTLLGVVLVALFSVAGVLSAEGRLPAAFGWAPMLTVAFLLPIRNAGSSSYAESKVQLLVITIACMVGAMLILTSCERVWWMLRWLGAGGIAVTLIAQYGPEADVYERLTIAGGGTIGFGRATGVGLVAVAALTLSGRMPRLFGLAAAGTLIYSLLASGSRGPLLAAGVAILLLIVARRSEHRARDLVIVAVSGAIGVVWAFGQASTFTQDRILLLVASNRGSSIDARERLFSIAGHQAWGHPLGIGWGNLEPLVRPDAYPHNILLETFAEGGWLTGMVLVAALVTSFARTLRRADEPVAVAAAALLAFFVFNALVSGDLNDNRAMFAMLGLALVVPELQRPGINTHAASPASTRSE